MATWHGEHLRPPRPRRGWGRGTTAGSIVNTDAAQASPQRPGISWLVWVLGVALAVMVLAGVATWVITKRRKRGHGSPLKTRQIGNDLRKIALAGIACAAMAFAPTAGADPTAGTTLR